MITPPHILIGLLAATCTTLAFLPQAIQIIRSKKTKDISFWTYAIFTLGLFGWLIYGVLIYNLPLIIANAISLILSSFILILKIKYH